jgi:hypothetical protein
MTGNRLLQLARSGDQAELVRALERATAFTHQINQRGVPMTETEKLLDEALWYARNGDLDEAAYRLSL